MWEILEECPGDKQPHGMADKPWSLPQAFAHVVQEVRHTWRVLCQGVLRRATRAMPSMLRAWYGAQSQRVAAYSFICVSVPLIGGRY